MTNPVLKINNLTVSYRQGKDWLDAVRNLSLSINPGETYGLVGESGSGKSTLALAVLRHLDENGRIQGGSIELAGQNLTALNQNELREIWRKAVKLVPQNPLASLNPSLRIGEQIAETLSGDLIQTRVLDLLRMVKMTDPQRVAESYPHQLSGGMQQRVMIALALSGSPKLLVLDEPTTGLDVTTEAVILDLIKDLIRQRQTAVLYVSHNLGVVAQICNRVAVLYAGELVEDAPVSDLYRQPLHPYTQGLLNSLPRVGQNKAQSRLQAIPGQIPALNNLPGGCVFAPRCSIAIERCSRERPPLETPFAGRQARCFRWPEIADGTVALSNAEAALSLTQTAPDTEKISLNITNLEQRFSLRRSLKQILQNQPAQEVRAVDGVTLQLKRGHTLGLVGESGSGKTTLIRAVIGLTERSNGEVSLLDLPLSPSLSERDEDVLRQLQMVFQNPEEALNPYRTVGDALRRTLSRLAGYAPADLDEGVARLLSAVKLDPNYAQRMPAQLSGGEKQRVAIARAFASQPELILFDESVSALDVSVQASILNLLNELQREGQNTYLFISHDLGVVSYLADEIAVIYLGHLMEVGRTKTVLTAPFHPYTEALISAIPLPDPMAESSHIRLEGDVPSPINIPAGCRFHTRCPRVVGDICRTEEPPWQQGQEGHRIYCHIPLDELRAMQEGH